MSDVHLCKYININIYDRNIREHTCKFIAKTNSILYDFDACDSDTLINIHQTCCMDLYVCELWNLNSKYIEQMHIRWRIAMWKLWKLNPRRH